MSFSSWKDFREIVDEDERLITVTLLIDIGQNLIADPQREQHRVLPQQYVDEVFAAYPSALACLQAMGFQKSNDDLVFDASTRKETLEKIVAILEGKQVERPAVEKKKDYSSLVPPIGENEEKNWTRAEQLQLRSTFAERFPIRSTLKQVQSYEDRALREFIRKEIIPLDRLCQRVEEKELSNPLDRRDALVVELLSWFKDEFFTWFDQSFCERCSKPMKFLRFTPPTERQRTEGDAQRVELYRCEICSSEETFPRYNNIWMLLKTRSGRCGEAANLFTCLCRALSFEARYIHDPSDHVWTEFFSVSQQRWIHCDACENLSDSPLIYERGWNKQLQFCLAFAKDHLEDVTWRYVTDFPATIQRRKIDEKQFERFLHRVNSKLQKNLAATTKKQISLLRMRDLVEMLRPRTLSTDAELNGRQSGSLQWRLSRQETQQKEISSGFVYRITDEEVRRGSMTVEYNSVDDEFSRDEKAEGAKWNERFFSYANLQRKVEKDWKMVYLARKDLHQTGWAKIQFEIPSAEQQFGHIRVDCPVHQFDQFGSVQVFLNYGDEHVSLSSSSSSSSSFEYDFSPKSIEKFQLEIVLSSSNDDNDANAWQKTQLFRQSILPASSNDRTHLFRIELNFRRGQ